MKLSFSSTGYPNNHDYNFNLLDGLILGLIFSGLVMSFCLLALGYTTTRLLISLVRPIESPTIC
ncbi:MAG: hypothetical protein QNJ46_28955 [Leptolyngbyaceae cyanobacterium MO_188.B28]|nr:hypothetical protein [Leptolyngbyaceae cyanobacterium MO_188.B28]